MHFIAMEKLGVSLQDVKDKKGPLRVKCIAQIGISLVDQIKLLHSWGYLH
jgi:hypothetical protein